ncbi:hypothetical protein [Streptomyces sp. NPDC014006]|uniref:hypothetical protein n=1 Tax=Streptomyces sp. NPDC014006 TaxID=3364870 RepID=UPI003701D816
MHPPHGEPVMDTAVAVGGPGVHALDYQGLLYIGAAVAVAACLVARGRGTRPRSGEERPAGGDRRQP